MERLNLDSSVFTMTQSPNGILIHEVYSIKGGPNIYQHYGQCSKLYGCTKTKIAKWERRSDLREVLLKNVLFDFPPFHMLITDENHNPIDSDGLFTDILKILSRDLNFKIDYVKPREATFGAAFSNGTNTGLIGTLARQEADIAAAMLTITRERNPLVDFSSTIMTEMFTLTVRNTEAESINIFAFIGVFTSTCWLIIVLLLSMSTLGLFTMKWLLTPEEKDLLSTAVGTVLVLSLQQENQAIERVSERILVLTMGFTTYILHVFFPSVLVSILTIQSPQESLRSLSDILPQDYQMITVINTGGFEIISQAQEGTPLHKVFLNSIQGNPESQKHTYQEAFETVRDSEKRLVYLGSDLIMRKFDPLGHMVNVLDIQDSSRNHLAFGFSKNSEFRRLFSHHLLKLEQSGLIRKICQKWMPWTTIMTKTDQRESVSSTRSDKPEISLSLQNSIFMFTIFGVGCFAGIAVFLAEKIKKT